MKNDIEKKRALRMKSHFKIVNDVLLYERLICVPRENVKEMLRVAHDDSTPGHFGYSKNLPRLELYHWLNKSQDLFDYCRGFMTCKLNRDERTKPLSVLHPLETSSQRWGSISIDLIIHLPLTEAGYDCVAPFVVWFSKRVHLIPSKGTNTATDVAECFFTHIFRLHGLPDSIISDRDPMFTSKFWSHLMRRYDIGLKMSTSRHPQTAGLSEVMYRTVGNYLKCYRAFQQLDSDRQFAAAEFSYNSSRVDSMNMTPFKADLEWFLKSPLQFLGLIEEQIQSVLDFKRSLQASFESAIFAQRLAQARQAAYNAKE